MSNKVVSLSASKIKTFCNCSYFFYLNYILRIPQSEHPSLPKGSLSHLILELLFEERHRKYLPKIRKARSIYVVPALSRLTKKHLAKANLLNEDVLTEINTSVFVGLDNDFLCKGALFTQGEYKFSIPCEDFLIGGFIDKIAVFKDRVVIFDYKTNKSKFSGDDKTANTQAFIYLWAARHLFPDKKKYVLKFLFLKYPKNPVQEHEYTQAQIDGFETWVKFIAKKIASFDEGSASSNFAADDNKRCWLCKAGKTWRCPYYNGFEYYASLNDKGEIIKTSLTPIIGDNIVIKKYEGCIRHKSNEKDSFFANS